MSQLRSKQTIFAGAATLAMLATPAVFFAAQPDAAQSEPVSHSVRLADDSTDQAQQQEQFALQEMQQAEQQAEEQNEAAEQQAQLDQQQANNP
jgi:hypothetical protein